MKIANTAKTVVTEEKSSRVGAVISGILVGYAITCIVFIGYSMLITYSNLTGENLRLVVTTTSLLSVVVAGFDASRGAESRGWLWGLVAGFIYAIILVLIGIWVNAGFKIDTMTLTLLVLVLAGGGLGGVVGINFKR